MDKIIIEGLVIDMIIGVYDWERQNHQKVNFDLELTTDFAKAMASDDVTDTIDYAKVAERIELLAQEFHPELLEKFADLVLKTLFKEFAISAIRLKITKPDILEQARSVGIELYRECPLSPPLI